MLSLADRDLYFGPDDDWQTPLLTWVAGTQAQLYICMYAFALVSVVDELIALKAAGKDVAVVLDRSQAATPIAGPHFDSAAYAMTQIEVRLGGSPEPAQIARLQTASIPHVIGNSAHGQIIHSKMAIRDRSEVFWGSGNWSLSAALQNNEVCHERDPRIAEAFLADWQKNWDRLANGAAA